MPDPIYRQIAEDLRQKIESGGLGPGSRLPSELELTERYRASRSTVRDALKWLVIRGLVETRPGQGTFVVEKIDPYVTKLTGDPETGRDDEGPLYLAEVTATLRRPTVSDPRVEVQQASGRIASELLLAGGSAVVSRSQQRYIDATPWSLRTSAADHRERHIGMAQMINPSRAGHLVHMLSYQHHHQHGQIAGSILSSTPDHIVGAVEICGRSDA